MKRIRLKHFARLRNDKTDVDAGQYVLSGVDKPDWSNLSVRLTDQFGGRLTVNPSEPVPSSEHFNVDRIYLVPFESEVVSLYNTTAQRWIYYDLSSSISKSLDDTDIDGNSLSPDTNYDIYLGFVNNLELVYVPWNNSSIGMTRAGTIPTRLDGVLVHPSRNNLRYIGTFRTISSTSPRTEDSKDKAFLWNMYNRRKISIIEVDSTSFSSSSFNFEILWGPNGSPVDEFQKEFVLGMKSHHRCEIFGTAVIVSAVSRSFLINIGIDQTGTRSSKVQPANCTLTNTGYARFFRAKFENVLDNGYHSFEGRWSTGSGSGTINFNDSANADGETTMMVELER